MKPAWNQLAEEYAGDPTRLVTDVDCTAEGEPLCDLHDIEGFPTIRWGDPDDLQDYEGGRDYEDLKAFAEENLKPVCSVNNIDLCDDEKKAEIKKFQAMPAEELEALIEEAEAKIEAAEEKFEAELEELQEKYAQMNEEKEAAIAEVKKQGLNLMRSVKASKSSGNDEL